MPIVIDSPIRLFTQDEFHARAHQVLGVVFELHNEYGRLLDEALYREAINHFFGGAARLCREVEVFDGNAPMGTQTLHMLNNDAAFTCTAITRAWDQMRDHQRRFLSHTRLRAVQWVNLNHATIEFATITREELAE